MASYVPHMRPYEEIEEASSYEEEWGASYELTAEDSVVFSYESYDALCAQQKYGVCAQLSHTVDAPDLQSRRPGRKEEDPFLSPPGGPNLLRPKTCHFRLKLGAPHSLKHAVITPMSRGGYCATLATRACGLFGKEAPRHPYMSGVQSFTEAHSPAADVQQTPINAVSCKIAMRLCGRSRMTCCLCSPIGTNNLMPRAFYHAKVSREALHMQWMACMRFSLQKRRCARSGRLRSLLRRFPPRFSRQ